MPLSPEQSETALAGITAETATRNHRASTRNRRKQERSQRHRAFQPYSRQVIDAAFAMLEQGMRHHERKLNSKLLAILRTEFSSWIHEQAAEFNRQLKVVPKQSKQQWIQEKFDRDLRTLESRANRLLCEYIPIFIDGLLSQIELLKCENREFRRSISKVQAESETRHIILEYAAMLGSNAKDLNKDRKALDRWLDEEAMNDRFLKVSGEKKLLVVFALNRLGETVALSFQLARQYKETGNVSEKLSSPDLANHPQCQFWQRLNLENRLCDAVQYEGDDRIPSAALKCLRRGVEQLAPGLASHLFDHDTRVIVNRIAMDANADVWVQCEAINICTLLDKTNSASFLQNRLNMHHGPDDIFVRRHLWRLLARLASQDPRFIPNFGHDPSPFVRQAIVESALTTKGQRAHEAYLKMGLRDGSEKVRAAALACSIGKELSWEATCRVLDLADRVLKNETNAFVLRTTFHVAVVLLRQIMEASNRNLAERKLTDDQVQRVVEIYRNRLEPAIRSIECRCNLIPVRRWAAQTCEKLWAILDDDAANLIAEVRKLIATTDRGNIAKLPNSLFADRSEDSIGRALSVLTIEDFGYEVDVKRGRFFRSQIRRGDHFGFRLWRFWYELTHPATDKRQALRHTVGRISTSTIRVPSQICGELSETKVPGEPLTLGIDGTWRPFLPLLDDFVSLLNMGWFKRATKNFYSSQGITRLKSPKSMTDRLRAFRSLSFQFTKIAKLRNWNNDSWPPHKYIDSLRELGFEVSFERYTGTVFPRNANETDDSVEVFFKTDLDQPVELSADDNAGGFALLAATLDQQGILRTASETILDFAQYFYSPFENSLPQLVAFATVILLLFIGRHFLENYRFRKARRSIPLSIGGWGTRGKSGTERLKAALLGVMGHGLVSKTTGCEAMFIHGDAHGDPLEIPLFRPYDKATIWEQKNLISLAAKMNPSVFLWECMALTPSYVDVLQRQWTQDDLGTITNTYPDHEDVQGPAGHNVATTISGFVPVDSHLITTEAEMLPFVSESCRHAGTSLDDVGWLESGLVTEDVLARFPYQEHPNNIALVAAMGRHLGCEYDYSLKAMADFLVPDLGVLKTHPVSIIKCRKIEFTNGCSANERFGCMGNWKRLGFDTQDPWTDPGTWICGVVNNRADRVPRSKVFAKIIVEDVNADRFFLIGSNLDGLQSFINEALQDKVNSLSLKLPSGQWSTEHALETLQRAAWNLRLPITQQHVDDRLRTMMQSVEGDETCTHHSPEFVTELTSQIVELNKESADALADYQALEQEVRSLADGNADIADEAFRSWYANWYQKKIVVVPKLEATGEEIIARIVDEVPPGVHARIMGLQNIKGTGLDFVYRFQAWDTCHEACQMMAENNTVIAQKGLDTLSAMPFIGQLCQELVAETIGKAKRNPALKRSDAQKQLTQLRSKLESDSSLNFTSDSKETIKAERGLTEKLKDWVYENAEQYFDVNDSLHRREKADLIYRELAECRISRQRAILEMRKINKRQKGGWLKAGLEK
jgi:poly-gamma-glutamate synthase PgsB/CapB